MKDYRCTTSKVQDPNPFSWRERQGVQRKDKPIVTQATPHGQLYSCITCATGQNATMWNSAKAQDVASDCSKRDEYRIGRVYVVYETLREGVKDLVEIVRGDSGSGGRTIL